MGSDTGDAPGGGGMNTGSSDVVGIGSGSDGYMMVEGILPQKVPLAPDSQTVCRIWGSMASNCPMVLATMRQSSISMH